MATVDSSLIPADVAPGRFVAVGRFKIVKLLPPEGDEQQYRIKNATEPHERVAKESRLARDS